MAQADVVAFNIASFISSLLLLESGADKFIDHTSIIARRTGIPETVIGLVTAGGEWEELAVVIVSIVRGRKSLALGNIIGSGISKILGAFSLGLLSQDGDHDASFDRSSRIYSALLLLVTTFVVPVTYFNGRIVWLVCGSTLLASFAAYLGSVGWALRRGFLNAPEGSDSDSSDDESESDSSSNHSSRRGTSSFDEETRLLRDTNAAIPRNTNRRNRKSLHHHVLYLIYGFLAICLAGYILAQSAANIIDEFHISDVLFGVVILAIATTLPEKFIAVMSGRRHSMGILVANTAGSNIFLLTLCIGVVMIDAKGVLDAKKVTMTELCILWGSTLAFTLTVWFGARYARWIGAAMVSAYIAFIVLEFTVIHGSSLAE